ncbi:hypothetical protein FRB99_005550, partial [Tulasnella sp. 403]
MAAQLNEKVPSVPPTLVSTPAPSSSRSSVLGTVASPFTNLYSRFTDWKAGFDLPNPGTVENLQKEVKQTHLTNYIFDGARADLTKGLSMDPAFQVTHSFSLASQNSPASYHFGAVYATANLLLQGGVGDDGNLTARLNKQWSTNNLSKVQAQLGKGATTQNMIILEHDYTGSDYSLNFKAMNPSPANGSGIYIGNYLQSVTKNLALGVEALYQRPTPDIGEFSTSYLLKYTGTKKDWIATAQMPAPGVLQASYWHKLSEKVEVAADMQMVVAPQRREAITTLGAKYDFRMATFRAQVDSTGKVSALLEQKFAPTFAFLFAGEIDHFKNAAKVGVGVMIESTSLTPEEMGYGPQAGFRPQNALELREGGEIVVSFDENLQTVMSKAAATLVGPEKDGFTFDRVFPPGTRQVEVFDYGVKGIVKDVLDGYNGTVFAYGQTGSGKTFTMMGADIDDEELKGIIPRITEQIFTSIVESDSNFEYLVKVSYMEIYLEKIRDLMAPQNDNLQIHEEKSKGVYVKGLSDYYVGSAAEVYEIMRQGGTARVVTATNMNAESSRSHSIFLITINQRNTETGTSKTGNLYLVDLAGSEKVGKTGASGTTLEEAKKINKSLSALGMVINALTDGKSQYVPYRDSKLTRILQESLGGNSRTTLIINCSPSSYNEPETLSTLRFGMRAKSIKNSARVNAELSPAELKGLLKKAQTSNSTYQAYIAALEAELAVWRSGGKVEPSNYATADRAGVVVSPVTKKPPSSRAMTPSIPALESLRDLESRPQTPTIVGLDKDEREEFLKRENELTDQLAEKESALSAQAKLLADLREELSFVKEQESSMSQENKDMSTQLNDLRLRLERLDYENKEGKITIDILKDQNQDLSKELEELQKNLSEFKSTSKDAAAAEDKERKKAEKMALMMANFDMGAFSDEREESLRIILTKLDSIDTDAAAATLTADDIILVRRQLVEGHNTMRDTIDRLRQSQEEKELVLRRKEEVEERLTSLETEFEELLEKTIDNEEGHHGDMSDMVADLKASLSKLEAQYNAKREAHASEIQDLRAQLELKAGEIRSLQTSVESMKSVNEELKRAFAVTSAGIEGGKNLAESAKDLEKTRKAITVQLAEFDGVKKSLMRDLQNRCEKVVELEIQLDELKELYNNVIRNSNSKAQQKKMAFLERNLEQLTLVQKQLVDQNTMLKKEAGIAERKLLARNERIQNLELMLQDAERRLNAQNARFEEQLKQVRDRLEQARAQKQQSTASLSFGRIAKPLRGGGGGTTGGTLPVSTGSSQSSYASGGSASPFARLQSEEGSLKMTTSVSGTTSRKPSGSSTHSAGHSPSASPHPGVQHKLGPAANAVFAGGMGGGGALKVVGGAWQDPNGPLNFSRQRQAAVAQAAALSAPQRYDAPSSPQRNGLKGYPTPTSPYAPQHASLPTSNSAGSYDSSLNASLGSAETDLTLGIKGLSVQDEFNSSGGHPIQKLPGHYSQASVLHGNQSQLPGGVHQYPSFPQPDYSAYYGNPTHDSYGDYSYSYRPPLDPSVYGSPPPPTPRAPIYGTIATPQIPAPAPHDVVRSPTGLFYPDYAAMSRQATAPYFYPTPQAVMFHPPPQSPHVTNQLSGVGSTSSLGDKKRELQAMQLGFQQPPQQLSHQANLFLQMRHPSNPMPSSAYSGVGNYPSSMHLNLPQRAVSYTAPYGGMRPQNLFRQPGTPKSSRRAGPDTSSSADSGIGLRSALLEEFRSNKTKKWELRDILGSVVEFSGDQHGSRFIQQRLESATSEEKQQVFDEIVPDHALPLMTDVFGNYVIQKLFEYGTMVQKDILVGTMSGHILALSLQMYGCRVVQKAIEHIPPEQQSFFVNEIDSQVLKCVKDANGNHVIQKLIERVVPERLTFIEAFKGNVHELSTHPYGCRVLQRCFEHLTPEQTRPLLDELHRYTSTLMQDQFGNYVIQFVLEHGTMEDRNAIISTLSGHMLAMARHKFASNVCEKALVTADPQARRVLLSEIMSNRPDGQNVIVIMMKDQYANYVLQRALAVAEGDQLDELLGKIRPQLINLRRYSNNYSKHLASIERMMIEKLPKNSKATVEVESTDAADLFASSDVTGTDSLWGQNVTADATHQWLTQQEGHQNAAEQQDIPTGNYEYAGQDTHLPTTVEDPYASQGWYDEHGQWHEYQDSTHQEQNWVQSSEYDVSGGENSAYAPTAYDYGYPNHNAPSQSVSSTTSPTYPETSTTGYSSGGSYASQEPYDPYQPASSSYLPHPNPTTMVTSPSGHTTVATTPNSTPAPARKVASSNTVYASPAAYDPYKPTATSYSAPPAKPAPPATGPSISSTPYQTQSSLGSKPTQNASSAYRSTSYNAYDPPIPNRARKTARSPSLTSPPPSASYYGYGATPVEAVFSKPITSSPQPPPPPSHHQPPPAPPVHNGRQPPLALQNYGSPESVYNPYSPPVQNVVSPPPNGAYPASAYGANPVPIAAPPSSGYGHGIIDAADAAQAHSWAHDKPLSNGSGQYESGWYRDDHSQGQQPVMQQIDLQEPSYDPEGAETPHYDPYRDEGAQHAVGNVVPETEGTTHASFAASMSMTVMPTVVPNNAYAPPVGPYVPGRKDSVLSISSHGSRPSSRAGPPPASKAQTSPSVSTKTANSVNGSLPASPQHSSPSLSSPPPAHQYPAKPPPRTGTPGSIRARVASPDMHPSMVAAASRKSPRPDSYPGSNASSVSSPAAHLEAARSRIASPEVGVKLPPPVKPNANGAIAPYDPYKPARTASLSVSETGRSVDSAIPRSASPYSMSTTEDHHASPYDPYAPRQHTRKQTSESMDYGIEYTSRYDVAQPASQSPPYVPYASTPTPAEPPYPVRTSIESVYAPSLTQTGGDDILRRADCSTRCPILTFGFGGKVVSFFPNQMDATTGFDVSLISRKPAPVTIRQLKDIMEDNRTYPGPLFSDPGTPTVNITRTAAATVKAKKGLVVKYLEERSEEVERGLAHLEPLDRSKAAGRLCLIQLLKVMIENDGKISGTPEIEKAVRGILVPRLKDSPDSSASYAFTTPATNSMLAPGDPMHPAGLAHGDATVATYTVRSGALDKIQDYLLRGEKRIAYRHALDERLWAHAMLIASSLDKEAWKEVVTEFIRTELGVDPSRVAADPVNGREALRVTYGMFAGLGYGSVQELLPPKPLTRSSGAANPMLIAPSPMTIPSPALGSAIPQPTKLAFTGDAPVAILAKWQETAAAILSNATNGDAVAMTALGDFLMTNKWVDAAHVCYLLSPHTSLLGGFGSTAAKVVLVGSENPQNRSTFHTDVDPLIFSEILEFALSLAPSPKGQDAFTGVPHLQAYRLIHAFQLAELGYISVASRYCEAIASALRLSKASQYYTPTFQEQLKDLSDRLSGTPQLDKTGSWIA